MIFDGPEYLDPFENQFPADINAVQVKLIDLQLYYSNIIILSDEIDQILLFLII